MPFTPRIFNRVSICIFTRILKNSHAKRSYFKDYDNRRGARLLLTLIALVSTITPPTVAIPTAIPKKPPTAPKAGQPATPVAAPAAPVAAPTVTVESPQTILVNGRRGSTEARNLTVSASSAIKNAKLQAIDITSTDGGKTFPQSDITFDAKAKLPATNWGSSLQEAGLIFNLNAPPGEYLGRMLLTFEGGRTVMPLLIKIADPPFWPFICLFLGTVLGISLSIYRQNGRLRDETILRMDQLKQRLDHERNLGDSFGTAITRELMFALHQIDQRQWTLAAQTVQKAEDLWDKWIRYRPHWIQLFQQAERLQKTIQSVKDQALNATLLQELEDALTAAPSAPDPGTLRTALQEIRKQIPANNAAFSAAPEEESLPLPGNEPVLRARTTLIIFKTVSYVVALGMLIWIGWNELYLAKPTFGANTNDYFALFAAGFGIEASRASVLSGIKSWGLPGLS